MSSEPLDELYFKWLYEQVADPGFHQQSLTYWKVLRILFTKEFVWVVDVVNDENRIKDGKALRVDFLREKGIGRYDVDPDWIEIGCSVLELMVGLSRRMAFMADGEPHYWFWEHLMKNIGLSKYSDDSRRIPRMYIDRMLDRLIFRIYEPSGLGGFFPLEDAPQDQTKVELWYQLSAYVMERELAG